MPSTIPKDFLYRWGIFVAWEMWQRNDFLVPLAALFFGTIPPYRLRSEVISVDLLGVIWLGHRHNLPVVSEVNHE